MLRVHLTAEDLARIRIRPTNFGAAEVLLGLDALQRGSDAPIVGNPTKFLIDLWSQAWNVDLVTVAEHELDLRNGLDAFRRAPVLYLNAEHRRGVELLNHVHGPGTPTYRARLPTTCRDVVPALEAFRHRAQSISWEHARADLLAEHTRLEQTLAHAGVGDALDSVHPSVRWEAPVLTIDAPGLNDLDIYPQGRGLVITPTIFVTHGYVAAADMRHPAPPIRLHYPIIRAPSPLTDDKRTAASGRRALVDLLGRTRAGVLQAISEAPCTTSELAARTCTSLSSASQHATVLRNAGLIETHREGQAVRHGLTAVGTQLIRSSARWTLYTPLTSEAPIYYRLIAGGCGRPKFSGQ